MDHGGIVLHCLTGIENGGQNFIINLHKLGGAAGDVIGFRGNAGNHLALVTNLALSQYGEVVQSDAGEVIGNILAGNYGMDTG